MIDYALINDLHSVFCDFKEDVDDYEPTSIVKTMVAERRDQQFYHLVAEDFLEKVNCFLCLVIFKAFQKSGVDLLSYDKSTLRVNLISFPYMMSFKSSACS